MEFLKSDYTTVVRDKSGITILKARILDDKWLLFQMKNKTRERLSPCFKIKADFGLLKMVEGSKKDSLFKKWEKEAESTKSINRARLVMYYNQFKLYWLVGLLKDKNLEN